MPCQMGTDCASGKPMVMAASESVLVADEVLVHRDQELSDLASALSRLQEDVDVITVSMRNNVENGMRRVQVALEENIDAVVQERIDAAVTEKTSALQKDIDAAVTEKTSALQKDLRQLEAEMRELRKSHNGQNKQALQKSTSDLTQTAAQITDRASPRHPQSCTCVLDWRLAEARMAKHKCYELRETIWDIVFFLGMKVMCPSDEVIVYFVGISNLVMQLLFILLLEQKMTGGDFNDEKIVQEYLNWRVMYAHDPKYADAFTNVPVADAVCTFNPINMEGAMQASTYSAVHAYLATTFGFKAGAILCMLAIFLWVFACVRECENAMRALSSLWCTVYHSGLPQFKGFHRLLSARSTVVIKDEEIAAVEDGDIASKTIRFSCSFRRALLITVFVTTPRLVILVILCSVGSRFLVSNIELSEFILNAVALEVVLNVDELLYEIFVPAIPRMVLARTLPLRRSLADQRFARALPYFKIMAVAASVLLIWILHLRPVIKNVEDVERVMCEGDKEFLAAELSIGAVFAGVADAKHQYDQNSYKYLAVLQRTGLREASLAGPNTLYLDSDRIAPDRTLFKIPDVFQARVYQDLTIGQLAEASGGAPYSLRCMLDRYWQKTDPSAEYPIAGLLRQVFASQNTSCQALKDQGHCYARSKRGNTARFFCTNTCGLSDAQSGNAFESAAGGVPTRDCWTSLALRLESTPCEDLPQSHPAFAAAATSMTNLMTFSISGFGNSTWIMRELARFNHMVRSGCKYLATHPDMILTDLNMNVEYEIVNISCDPSRIKAFGFSMRSLRYLCPIACGCSRVAQEFKTDGKLWGHDVGIVTQCPQQCFNGSVSSIR